jgi:hypothetical protein
MKHALLLPLLVAISIGCGKSAPPLKEASPAQLAPGASLTTSSDKVVSIMVPSGWKRGSKHSIVGGGLGDMMGQLGEGGGELQDMAQGMQDEEDALDAHEAAELEKEGILIWVNDSSRPIPGEERTHFRIKRTQAGHGSVEDAAEDAKQDLLNEGPIQYVELPIGKAARMEASTTKIDGGQLFQIVYVLVNGSDTYNIRFTTQNDPSSVKSVEKSVIESLRIKPNKS